MMRWVKLRGIDTNLLVALNALLRQRNVTRAGRDVGLSQSAMSHALARLRSHYRDPLLVPAGRGLVLTDVARALVPAVEDAVARLESVFARPEPFRAATSSRVFRIAATDNLELYVMPKLAAVLAEEAPGIRVRVGPIPADWPAALRRGEIDLKLGRRDRVSTGLASEVLSREHFECVVSRSHRVRARPSLARYAGLRHLVVVPGGAVDDAPRSTVDATLARHGLARTVAMTVPHFLVAPFIAAQSDLVLTAPARLLAPFLDSLSLRRLALPMKLATYELAQVWALRDDDDAGHRWLRRKVAMFFT